MASPKFEEPYDPFGSQGGSSKSVIMGSPNFGEPYDPFGSQGGNSKKSVMKPRGKYKSLTIADKLKILDKIDTGEHLRKIMEEFKISSSTYYDIKKAKDKLRSYKHVLEDRAEDTAKRKRVTEARFAQLDEAVFDWYKEEIYVGCSVRGADIQSAAELIARNFGIDEFQASTGWLYRFRHRHNLQIIKPGEYHFVPPLPRKMSPERKLEDVVRDALPSAEERTSSELSQNNGDDGGVSGSPEQYLVEGEERESTPAPPTPTQQKPESYQLRHNNHLTLVLEALARDESFMDVTLTAQGRSLKAHKSVLSAVSPYFRGVLRDNPCQHPIIIMPRDVRFEELFSIVNYIYKGEMTVAAEDLTSLLKTAEILQVSGLAPSDSTATFNPQHESSISANPRSSSTSSSTSSSNMPARSSRVVKPAQRNSTPPARPKSDDSTINPTDFMDVDMTCVKEEVQSGGEEDESREQMGKVPHPPSPGIDLTVVHGSEIIHPTFSPPYDPGLQHSLPSTSADQSFHHITASVTACQDSDQSTLDIKTDPDTEVRPQTCAMESPTPLVCPHCEEHHREIESLLAHLRVRHPTKPSFTCRCGRVFTRQTYQQAHSKVCPNAS